MPKEQLVAPITGVLTRRLFNDGDSVQSGDTVAEMESMKMIFTIVSHSVGIIHYYAAEEDLIASEMIVAEVQF